MIREARALWRVSARAGNDDFSSASGVRTNTPYSFRTRFEDQGTFARVAQDAELNGPLSRMLRAETTLDAKLI
jgi:hypothetical protein